MAQDTIRTQQDFSEYLEALKSPLNTPIFKVVLLNQDETEQKEITGDLFDSNGSLQNTFTQFGIRRTFTIQLDNSKGYYDIDKNNIFIGQKVALYAGLRTSDRDFLFKQGIYYLTSPQDTFNPITKTITLVASDKWYGLSSLYGFLDSIYYIPVVLEGDLENRNLNSWNETNKKQIISIGNTIKRENSSDWTSWIQSTFRLNTGSFDFKINNNNQQAIIGFSKGYNGNSLTSITCGFKINNNIYEILENNVSIKSGIFNVATDTLRMILLMNQDMVTSRVEFWKVGDDNYLYSIPSIEQTSYLIASTIYGNGHQINDIQYSISTQIFEYDIYNLMTSILQLPQRSNIRIIASMPEIIGNTEQQINDSINKYIYTDRKMLRIRKDEAVKDISNNNIFYCISDNEPYNTFENTEWKLFTDNITPLDPKLPLLDPFFNEVDDGNRLIMPYSIKKTRQDTYSSIYEEFAKMLPCNIYYNIDGRLTNEPTVEDILDWQKEILFDFDDLDSNLYSITSDFNTEEIFNDVTVVGNIQDVGTYSVRIVNEDPRLPTNISAVPNRSKTYENLPTYSILMFSRLLRKRNPDWSDEKIEEEALNLIYQNIKELAYYYLKQSSAQVNSITITCIPLYHLEVNKLVRLRVKGLKGNYLIQSYTLPLNPSGSMTINCQKAIDFVDDINELRFTEIDE